MQERGEGQDLRLCLVILAQCMGALRHLWRHPVPSTDPARGPPNSDAVSHCGGTGHTSFRRCIAYGGAERWLLELSPCPLSSHAVWS